MFDGFYAFLARLGYTHPIHAPITHMPIGLTIAALLFFLTLVLARRKSLELTANQCIALALIFAFPTILFGVMDWQHRYGGVMLPVIRTKIILASALVVLLVAALLLNRYTRRDVRVMLPMYLIGAGIVIALGYFGGQLVFGSEAQAALQAARAQGQVPAEARGAVQPQGAVSPESLRVGEQLYGQYCSGCHAGFGNTIVPQLPVRGAPVLQSREKFVAFLRDPMVTRDGRTYTIMPAFGTDTLSDAQAGQLYQYIVQNLGQ